MSDTNEQDRSHNFIETTDKFGEFHRILYCTRCGTVAWDFNRSEKSIDILQKSVPQPCPGLSNSADKNLLSKETKDNE